MEFTFIKPSRITSQKVKPMFTLMHPNDIYRWIR